MIFISYVQKSCNHILFLLLPVRLFLRTVITKTLFYDIYLLQFEVLMHCVCSCCRYVTHRLAAGCSCLVVSCCHVVVVVVVVVVVWILELVCGQDTCVCETGCNKMQFGIRNRRLLGVTKCRKGDIIKMDIGN